MHWAKCTLIVFAVICAIVLFVTLLSVSIKTINNDELGIKYHEITKVMEEDKVYEEGRYSLQPGESFFTFKRRFVTIVEPDILCLTQDGLQTTLDITYQYRLNKTQLVDFFKSYGSGYENMIGLLARTAARDACGSWSSEGFYYERERVQQDMAERMKVAFDKIHVESGFLQLSNVALPGQFQTVVRSTQEAKQDSEQAINERAEEITKAQTAVLQAEQTASIKVINAEADAFAIESAANAESQAILAELAAQAEAYAGIINELDLTPSELVNYIALQTIHDSDSPIVAVDSPANFAFTT